MTLSLKRTYSILILFIIVANFLFRLLFINIPTFADETNYNNSALEIAENRLNPFTNYFSYKPPLVYYPVAMLYRFVFPSRIWGRILTYIYSSLSLLLIYKLGKKFFDAQTGFWSSILFFSFPLFSAQSFLFTAEVAITAYFLVSLYFYVSKKYFLYAVFSSFLVMSKEPLILIPFALLLYEVYHQAKSRKFDLFKILPFAIPVFLFLFWLLANKIFLGFFINPRHLSITKYRMDQNILDQFEWVFYSHFIIHFNWIIFIFIYISCLVSYFYKQDIYVIRYRKLNIISTVLFVLFVSMNYFFIPLARYMLFAYSLIVLLFTYSITLLKVNNIIKTSLVFLFSSMLISSNLYSMRKGVIAIDNDIDFRFFRNIKIHQEVIDLIRRNYSNQNILTAWPIDHYLTYPLDGYVDNPIDLVDLNVCLEKDPIPLPKYSIYRSIIVINSPLNCVQFKTETKSKKIVELYFDTKNKNHSIKIFQNVFN